MGQVRDDNNYGGKDATEDINNGPIHTPKKTITITSLNLDAGNTFIRGILVPSMGEVQINEK